MQLLSEDVVSCAATISRTQQLVQAKIHQQDGDDDDDDDRLTQSIHLSHSFCTVD